MDILICINIVQPQLLHYHINTMNAQFYGTTDALNCIFFWILYLKQETKKKNFLNPHTNKLSHGLSQPLLLDKHLAIKDGEKD